MLNNDLNIRRKTSYKSTGFTGIPEGFILDSPSRSELGAEGWKNHMWQNFSYTYNEDGFRTTFPYSNSGIIAIGDSFTEHHGGPEEEQWTQHIHGPGTKTPMDAIVMVPKIDVINLGMDGAGNDTIADIVEWGVNKFKPHTVLIMFSFLHRWNDNGELKADDTNDERCRERMLFNFNRIVEYTKGLKLIYSFIPDRLVSNNEWINEHFPDRIKYRQTDYARDGVHFGYDTVRSIGDLFSRAL